MTTAGPSSPRTYPMRSETSWKRSASCWGGAPEARCSSEEEPGEYRWIFRRSGHDVCLAVLAFPDQLARQPDEQGRLLFRTTQPLPVIALVIADGAAAVLNEYGEDRYLEEWVEAPFPTAHLAVIRRRLAAL